MEIASPLSFHRRSGAKRQFSSPSPSAEENENYDASSIDNNMMGEAEPAEKHDTSTAAQQTNLNPNPFKRRRRFFQQQQQQQLSDGGGGGGATKEENNLTTALSSGASSSSSLHHQGSSFSSWNSNNNAFNGNNFYGTGFSNNIKYPRRHVESSSDHRDGGGDVQNLIRSQTEEIKTLRAEKKELQDKLLLHASTAAAASEAAAEQMKVLANENRILKRGVAIQTDRHNQAVAELGSVKNENVQLRDANGQLQQQIQSLQFQLHIAQSSSYNNNNRPMDDFMDRRPPDVF